MFSALRAGGRHTGHYDSVLSAAVAVPRLTLWVGMGPALFGHVCVCVA